MRASQSACPTVGARPVDLQALAKTLATAKPILLLVMAASPEPRDDADLLSVAALAARYRLNAEALRKRLQRWQAGTMDGWVEVEDRARNQPRYLYRVGAVRHLFGGLGQEAGQNIAAEPAAIGAA
jgi:hypothetical protein